MKALAAAYILLSPQFIKFTLDNICNDPDLMLRNIATPTDPFNQSIISLTCRDPLPVYAGLFVPDSIRFKESRKASTYLEPKAFSSLFMFLSENTMSTFSFHSVNSSDLNVLSKELNISDLISPANQLAPGFGYCSVFCINCKLSANILNS